MNYLITGASGGIGKQIFKEIYTNKDKFYLFYNKKKIISRKKNVFSFKIDFKNLNQLERIIKKILAKINNFDYLINCAGNASPYKEFFNTSTNEIKDNIDINLISHLIILRENIKRNLKNNKSLTIVNLSSNTISFSGSQKNIPYLCSKVAMEIALKNISKHYSKFKIRINNIRPGVIDSGMTNKLKGYDHKRFKKRISLIPGKKPGLPTDISSLVKFLLSDKSKFIYGQTISVSGGE